MSRAAIRLEYRPLKSLRKWPKNPKEHDLGALHESLQRFGFVNPIIVNERTGQVVAGHGRLDALMQRAATGDPMPERIKRDGDDWSVPVLVVDMDEREADAYAVADNRLVELGGWDEAALSDVLSTLALDDSLAGVGYDQDDLDGMLRGLVTLPSPLTYGDGDLNQRNANNSRMGSKGLNVELVCIGRWIGKVDADLVARVVAILDARGDPDATAIRLCEDIVSGG